MKTFQTCLLFTVILLIQISLRLFSKKYKFRYALLVPHSSKINLVPKESVLFSWAGFAYPQKARQSLS